MKKYSRTDGFQYNNLTVSKSYLSDVNHKNAQISFGNFNNEKISK